VQARRRAVREGSEAAKERFIKALLIDPKCSLAMSYLVDVLKEQGVSFTDCDNYGKRSSSCSRRSGFTRRPSRRREEAHGLHFRPRDVRRMINLYKRSGHTAKIHEIYFEMGQCALANNRPDLARDFFDEAIDGPRTRTPLRPAPERSNITRSTT